MKTILLSAGLMALSFGGFSQDQCPSSFSRTNGNNSNCASHIRLAFATCPTTTPTLDSIKINGVLEPETFTELSTVCSGNNIYVDYCISDNNLPPAAQITVYLTYPNGTVGGTSTKLICNVVGPSGGPTPVILNAFNVQRTSKDVIVTWRTQQEINSSTYEIERADDNLTFQSIGKVAASGNSNTVLNYSFTDKMNNKQQTSFYRLKMIDKDGSFAYSETKSVNGTNSNSDYLIYPNPVYANSKVTINNLNGPSLLKIIDLAGRIVNTYTIRNTNSTEVTIQQKGTYFLQIKDLNSGETSVRKLSVIN